MPRLNKIGLNNAEGTTREMLEGINRKLGKVPNLFQGFANSPATLGFYLKGSDALGSGTLTAAFREQIALAVAQANECDYCLAAHTALGKMHGLSEEQTVEARKGGSADANESRALDFVRKIVESRGHVDDADVQAVRAAGWSDGEISEMIANVAFNIFTNYFNHINETDVDFPKIPALV